MSSIVIRKKGLHEPCVGCKRDVEIFTQDAAIARFLIVRLAERPTLGGGRCPGCTTCFCIACSTKTVYGKGMRRLHCPHCGRFLIGIRRTPEMNDKSGAFLVDPPEFTGRAKAEELQGPNFFEFHNRQGLPGESPSPQPEAGDGE